jgi:hypothetical protein
MRRVKFQLIEVHARTLPNCSLGTMHGSIESRAGTSIAAHNPCDKLKSTMMIAEGTALL